MIINFQYSKLPDN